MAKTSDLKIELGAAFDSHEKAEKSAEIESLVSALESWINSTIRNYDEAVDS